MRRRTQPSSDRAVLRAGERAVPMESEGRQRRARGATAKDGRAGGQRGRREGRRRRGPLRWLAYWSAVLLIWLAIGIAGLFAWYAYDLPDVGKLGVIERRPSVQLLDANGSRLASFGDLYGEALQLQEIAPALPQAVLAIEDHRFYEHIGLDPIALLRAVVANIRAGELVQGGSTITQQLAKNVFLTPERSLKRKMQELMLAFWLEQRFSKDEILTLYLNRVYLGAGTYGVEAAAQRYFGKSAREVSVGEAAMLAGLLKAPSRYAPTRDLSLAQARARTVLRRMEAVGFLSAEQAQRVAARPATLQAGGPGQGSRYFADFVLEQVGDYLGPSEHDLIVTTSLDPKLQALAEAATARLLQDEGAARGVGQAAVVLMSPDGAVRAMVGGRSYAESQFNRATQARRQPGSAFKPVVYLAGLEAGLTPDNLFNDAPIEIAGWSPDNYDGTFRGHVTLREAFAKSINTVAVQVMQTAGQERVAEVALRLGITTALPDNLSIALGSAEVSLLELTGAFAPFANGGRGIVPHGVEEIRTADGAVLYSRRGSGTGSVMSRRHLAQMSAMLREVMRSGTGRAARLDRPAAGKTGTSQDFRDAWFVGFTADLVGGVWLGNDDGRPMQRVTGGNLPARLWRAIMAPAHAGRPAEPLPGAAVPAREGPGEGFFERLMRKLTGETSAPGASQGAPGAGPSAGPSPPAGRLPSTTRQSEGGP